MARLPDLWLESPRLWLRPWRAEDRGPFAAINADPHVMALMPSVLTVEQSDTQAEQHGTSLLAQRYGLWAVERKQDGVFLGFVGIRTPLHALPCQPCVEAAWRLARAAWGQGYASEAARAAFTYGFDVMAFDEIVALTVPANHRSQAVMQRLGMHRNPADDFDHPALPPGHALRRHVLYRLPVARWRNNS